MLARHIRRQHRQRCLRNIGLDGPVHFQRERVTHLGQWPPHRPGGAARRGQRVPHLTQQQVGPVMIQLISQISQRPATRPADLDLADQVTGQRGRQVADRQPRHVHNRLPAIIPGRQLGADLGLQALQHGGCSRRQRDRIPAPERLIDLFCGPFGLVPAGGTGLIYRGLYGGRDRPFQGAGLVTAAHECIQPLITGVGQPLDKPPHQVINDKHTSSLPPPRPAGTSP